MWYPDKKAGIVMDGSAGSAALLALATSSKFKLAERVLKEPWDGDDFFVGQGLESAARFFLESGEMKEWKP